MALSRKWALFYRVREQNHCSNTTKKGKLANRLGGSSSTATLSICHDMDYMLIELEIEKLFAQADVGGLKKAREPISSEVLLTVMTCLHVATEAV